MMIVIVNSDIRIAELLHVYEYNEKQTDNGLLDTIHLNSGY